MADPDLGDVFVGVDSGTQSTKVVLVDGDGGRVLGMAATPHSLIGGLPPGHLEQHPEQWFSALEEALAEVLEQSACRRDVRAIGVSGQQHGFVPLDERGAVIRPAKLWCDTSTARQCEEILKRTGGPARYLELTGNGLPPGFTASKIAWLKECEPHNFARLRHVLLPHDYLNYRLTGQMRMEHGDASGTALLDVRRRAWSAPAVAAVDECLHGKLPEIIPNDRPCGMLRPELAARWGLEPDVVVSSGGGDNMMSAIGTGNVCEGILTVSLGTSGTIYAYSSSPVIDPRGEVAAFCDSTGGWLPLVCTMNTTVATELTKTLFQMDNEQLNRAASLVRPGADGLLLVPYFDGERTPNVPNGSGVWFGADRRNQTSGHFARAAMEGVSLGLNYGLRRLRELGIVGSEVRLTGGGANSPVWRQIVADVFGLPAVCLAQHEAAACGAALQAMWCYEKQHRPGVTIQEVVQRCVRIDEPTRAMPDHENLRLYGELQGLHDSLSAALRACFDERHRIMTEVLSTGSARHEL